ncbi:hypothetical protein ACP4OV_026565 [Aristida adscensionis]
MSFKSKLVVAGRHGGGGGQRHLSLLLLGCLVVTGVLLLPQLPVSGAAAAATVVTHLPGFEGPLPFYLETGYVSVEEETGTELFYYFVESERDPATDPVLLWLCGGPRCSAFNALVYGVGPLDFVVKPYDGTVPQLVYKPDSWTQSASVLFVDSPVGAGFSYACDPKGYDVGDISSSMTMHTFVRKVERLTRNKLTRRGWFDYHPQYLSNPFYVGGDSYAGKVVPLIVQYISEGIEEMQYPLINLKGYIVGNPVTGNKIDYNSKIPYSHSFGIISDQLYEAAVTNCEGDYANPRNKLCADVVQRIDDLMSEVYDESILDNICPSGRRRALAEEYYELGHRPDEPPFSCFIQYRHYLSYFWGNNNETQAALGVKKGTVREWLRCKRASFPYTFDLLNSIDHNFNLTTRGYRALVYSGDHDLSVPFLGTQAWIRSFKFSISDDWRAWHFGGQAAGFTITYVNNLTFATVKVVAILLQKTAVDNVLLWLKGGSTISPYDMPLRINFFVKNGAIA